MPLTRAEAYEVDNLVAALVARVATRLRDATDAMTEDVLRRVPAYTTGRQGEPENLRSSHRRIIGLLLRVFEQRRRLLADELVSLHVIGAQAARSGLPVAGVTDGARVAMHTAWNRVLAELADLSGSPTAVETLGILSALFFDFGQDVTTALADGYHTEADQRISGKLRAQAAFIDRLLDGHWNDDTEIRSQARALGHDLGAECALLLVLPAAGQDVEALRRGAAQVAERLGRVVEGPLRTMPAAHIVLLASFPESQDWWDVVHEAGEEIDGAQLVVVPTEPVTSLGRLADGYRRAFRYLPLAHTVVRGPGIVAVKDLRLQAVLGGIPVQERVDFVREVLGRLLSLPLPKATELLETLECLYRRKGRVSDVAVEMHLHQNSIRYRLNRIEELTGLSLDVPGDRLHLELAMRLRTIAVEDLARLDTFVAHRDTSDLTA